MNSRNYETHVPPLASNTVTIATSSTGQGRLQQQFTGIRPLNSVPMRQVPIRKVVHDGGGGGGASTSSAQFLQIKEEVDDGFGTPTCSSGPLIASTSNSFQQYQRGGPTGGGGATVTSGALVINNNGDRSSMAMDQPAPVNLAAKVAEVFLTAGHAFQKLGDLTLQLHTTTDVDESKWSEKEVDNLKNALTRFAHDLDQISSAVQNRSTRLVKNEIKRRHMLAADDSQQAPKRMQMSGVGGVQGQPTGTYTTVNSVGMMSGHAVPLGQKRLAGGGGPTMGKLMAARTMIPAARFTVTPIPGSASSSGLHPSQSQSPSPGMPQLQSQGGGGGPSTSGGGASSRIISTTSATSGTTTPSGANSSTPTTITRVMAPQLQHGGGGVAKTSLNSVKQRVMTSVTMSMPTSGALVLEHND